MSKKLIFSCIAINVFFTVGLLVVLYLFYLEGQKIELKNYRALLLVTGFSIGLFSFIMIIQTSLIYFFIIKPVVKISDSIDLELKDDDSAEKVRSCKQDEISYIKEGFELVLNKLHKEQYIQKVIFDSVPALIFYKDWDNNIIRLNSYAAELMGLPIKEVEGRNTKEFYPEDYEKYLRDDREVISTRKPKLNIIEKYTLSSGEAGWYLTNKVPYYDKFGNVGVLVLVQDISQLKKTEAELIGKIKELESLDSEVGQFNYRISHDLKAPLSTTKGFCDLIKEEMKEGNLEEIQNYLEVIDKNTDKLLTLIDDVLEIGKIGYAHEDDVEVCLEKIVAFAKSQLADSIKKNEVEVTLLDDGPAVIKSKPLFLQQAIVNLISNSVKYASPARDSFAHLQCRRVDDHFEIAVIDNGLGIDKKYQSKVFSMFQRFHPKIANGSGLGLYFIKKSIEKIGGEVKFHSSEQGTTITLVIPEIK